MNISISKKITLSICAAVAFLSPLITTSSALALTWGLTGTFDDGEELGGTFDFDEDTSEYSNFDIFTTEPNTTYTNNFISGDDAFGFIVVDDVTGVINLRLDFASSLSASSGSIALNTSTRENNPISGDTRFLLSGEVTPVPFEPSANLAIFIILGWMGFNRYRQK